MIQVTAIKETLGITAEWVEELIDAVLQGVATIDFEAFMQFLENGNVVSGRCCMDDVSVGVPHGSGTQMVPPSVPSGMTPVPSKIDVVNVLGIANRSRDKKRRLLRLRTTQDPNATIYPEVMAALEYKVTSFCSM